MNHEHFSAAYAAYLELAAWIERRALARLPVKIASELQLKITAVSNALSDVMAQGECNDHPPQEQNARDMSPTGDRTSNHVPLPHTCQPPPTLCDVFSRMAETFYSHLATKTIASDRQQEFRDRYRKSLSFKTSGHFMQGYIALYELVSEIAALPPANR